MISAIDADPSFFIIPLPGRIRPDFPDALKRASCAFRIEHDYARSLKEGRNIHGAQVQTLRNRSNGRRLLQWEDGIGSDRKDDARLIIDAAPLERDKAPLPLPPFSNAGDAALYRRSMAPVISFETIAAFLNAGTSPQARRFAALALPLIDAAYQKREQALTEAEDAQKKLMPPDVAQALARFSNAIEPFSLMGLAPRRLNDPKGDPAQPFPYYYGDILDYMHVGLTWNDSHKKIHFQSYVDATAILLQVAYQRGDLPAPPSWYRHADDDHTPLGLHPVRFLGLENGKWNDARRDDCWRSTLDYILERTCVEDPARLKDSVVDLARLSFCRRRLSFEEAETIGDWWERSFLLSDPPAWTSASQQTKTPSRKVCRAAFPRAGWD
jgi:hypothetical protein